MTRKFMAISAAAVAAGLSLGVGVVRADQPTTEQLMQKIDQLQTKVDQLEAKQTDALSSKDVDATVDRVLNDAEQRSQLLQMEGFTAGYTKGRFTLQDASGNWVLRPRFEFQYRSISNWRDEGKHGGNDNDSEAGYQLGRMAFGADGVACNPNITYLFMWNTDVNGSVSLEEAWVRQQLNDSWALKEGQMRSPVFHEQAVGPTNQLTVDTSLANFLITGSTIAYTQAVELEYTDKNMPIWAAVGYEDGYNSANTSFVDPNEGGSSDWGLFARVNYYVKGNRADYNKLSAMGNKDDLLVIGGGGDITQVGDTTAYLHTVDVQWANTGGLVVYAAYLGDFVDFGGTDDTAYNWAILGQVGYALNDNWEIFARGDYTKFDSIFVSPGGDDSICELTLGGTYYMCGNNLKFTFDLSFLSGGAPSDITELGILATGNSELVLRGQVQLLL
jgi:outer membrane murein-binding lipoprotein Lpp